MTLTPKHLTTAIVAAVIATALLIALFANGSKATVPFDAQSVLPNGSRYSGQYRDGQFEGKGELRWENGNYYVGDFHKGMMHGEGHYVGVNGEEYRGRFENGFMSGHGEYQFGKVTYSGEFRYDRFNGQGELRRENGDVYVGEFKDGRINGKGKYTMKDGRIYEGDFVDSTFTGSGTMTYGKGNRYKGGFVDWKFQGQGELVTESGDTYRGHFENGMLTGKGERTTLDGDYYKGEFKNWRYDGKGELTTQTGDRYTGDFKNGFKEGKGELVYAKPKNGIKRKSGEWEFDTFIEDRKKARARRESVVEQIIYGQSQRLDRQLNALSAGTPGHIDLYFLGIGGYGRQDVFRKEVNTIHAQFDQRFGTKGHAVDLINNAETVGEIPLATVTSVRRALKAIEARMNTDEDILFLYATSHGSADHELSLSMEGLSLADLSADQLAKMLDETRIKWRVVVISACYSGGFIDPLRNATTLIITAAAKDRRSFGCSDKNDMTDFARAYFKEALPQAGTFEEAFLKARQLVEQEEKERKVKQHSLPQISMGDAMRKHLAEWRGHLGK